MTLESDVALLARLRVFSDLAEDHLRLLAFSAGHRELKKGQRLFSKGETATSGFVIVSGVVDFVEEEEGAERKVLASCDSGSLIGELSLFVETKRPATAFAAMECDLIELSRSLITRMLTEYPVVASRIRGTLTDRLQGTIAELSEIQVRLEEVERIARGRRR
jgi:CRP-like cAMP-binding protein